MILSVMLSLLGVFHYVNRVFYLGSPISPFFILTVLIVIFLALNVNKKQGVYIDKVLMTLAIGSAIFLLMEIIGYIFYGNHFEYRVVRSLINFGIHYFALTLIIDKYSIPKDLLVRSIVKTYVIVVMTYSSLTILSIFIIDNNYFLGIHLNKGYLISSSKIIFMSLLGVFFLWFYPKVIVGFKRFIAILLFAITPVLAFKTSGIILLILFGVLYILSIKKSLKNILLLSLAALFIWLFSNNLFVNNSLDSETILYGLDSKEEIIPEDEMLAGSGQLQSTYIRHITNRKAMSSFYEKPIFGSGEYHVKNEIRYAGYFSHTFYIYTLASYGLIGVIFIVLFFQTIGLLKIKSIVYDIKKRTLLLYIGFILLFISTLPLWIIPSIVIMKKYK